MKKLKLFIYPVLFIFFISCSQTRKEGSDAEQDHESGSSEGHSHDMADHDHDASEISASASISWMPAGTGEESIKSDFHFLSGSLENIKPVVIQDDRGTKILELTADGTPTSFVFHSKYSNVGLSASIKKVDFTGKIELIHHAKSPSNYEFVSIENSTMQLGRVIDGEQIVLDKAEFEQPVQDWTILKASAAGSHYKGYIGDNNVTHGHADEMEDGYVGIMLIGSGKIQISSIELLSLEDE
ncbi:MAG: hypothetical protein RIG77_12900 [Cyclobacteriaceae bacterium]